MALSLEKVNHHANLRTWEFVLLIHETLKLVWFVGFSFERGTLPFRDAAKVLLHVKL